MSGSHPVRASCFVWSDVANHRPLVKGRPVTSKDFAWLLLASVPELTVVDIEERAIGEVIVTGNGGLDRVSKIMEEYRPVNLLVRVEPFRATSA